MKKLLTLFTLLLTVCSGAWGASYSHWANDESWNPTSTATKTFTDGSTWTFSGTPNSSTSNTAGNQGSKTFYKWNGTSGTSTSMTCTISGHGINGTISKITVYNYVGTGTPGDGYSLSIEIGGETYGTGTPCGKNAGEEANKNATIITTSKAITSSQNIVITITEPTDKHKYFAGVAIEYSTSGKNPAELSYETASITKDVGDANFTNTLSNPNSLTVTYSITTNGTGSSINSETGEVTVGTSGGTETITASTEGDGTHDAGTATYTLKINLPAVSNKFWDFSDWTVADITSTTTKDNLELVATSDKIMQILSNNAQEVGDESFTKRLKLNGTGNASYRYVHFKVAPKSQIYVYQFSGKADRKLKVYAGSFNGTKLLEEGTTEYKKSICAYTGNEETDIYIYSGADNISIYGIKVEPMKQVTISPAKYATFASDSDLDFSGVEGLYAYTATVAGNIITFNKVTEAKAGEGLLLYADVNEPTIFNVPVATDSPEAVSGNKLVRGTGAAVTSAGDNSGEYNYVLSTNDKGEVNFYLAAGNTVPTSKAYLKNINPTAVNAKFFLPTGEDETDGIKSVQGSRLTVNGEAYNLAGQKVGADYKGIVIVNGKKVIRK